MSFFRDIYDNTLGPVVDAAGDAAGAVGGAIGGFVSDVVPKPARVPDFAGINEFDADMRSPEFDNRFADALANQDRRMLIDDLSATIQGERPSVAEAQLQQGMDQAQRQQFAQAASQGFNPAAQRAAMFNAAQIGQNTAAQAAALRAQELSQARARLAQALQQQDQLRLGYEQLGFNRDRAASLARQAFEDLRLREFGIRSGLAQANAEQGYRLAGGLLNMLGQGGAAAIKASDKNVKTNIEEGGDDIESFLNAINAFKYDYKGGEGAPQLGVMAQDLEKAAASKPLVSEVEGVKMVDYGKSGPIVMAALANLNERLNKMEAS